MVEKTQKRNLIEEWRRGRLKSSEGILTFLVMGIGALVAGTAILWKSALNDLGISLMIIGLLILLMGIAAKA